MDKNTLRFPQTIRKVLFSPIGKLVIFLFGLALLFYITQLADAYLNSWHNRESISDQQFQLFSLFVSSIKALVVSIVCVKLLNTIITLLGIEDGKPLNYRLVALVIIISLIFFFFQDGVFYSLFNPNQSFLDNDIAFGRVSDDFVLKIRLILEIDLETDISSTSTPTSLYFKGIRISKNDYPESFEYNQVCFDEILFFVSHYIHSFQLNPLLGEPKVQKIEYSSNLLEYLGKSNFPHPETPFCYTLEDVEKLGYGMNNPWYFEFPEKKDLFDLIYTYTNTYNLFYYPYNTKDIDFAIQLTYHLENGSTKSESRVIAPPIQILYNHTNTWNFESSSIIQPVSASQMEYGWSAGPLKIVQTSISGPTFYKVITIIILLGLYFLTGILLIIEDDGDFVGATGAILFGIFGTKQIISPNLPIEHNIIDTIIFFLYIFITLIVVERVILKIVKKQE